MTPLLFVELGVLLFCAFILGEIVVRLKQPAVIGQLAAGVLLSPAVLGKLMPGVYQGLFAQTSVQHQFVDAISWIGIIFLLLLAGMEMDLDAVQRQGKSLLIISIFGSIVPLAVGFAAGFFLPDEFMGPGSSRLSVAWFFGTLLSMSSVPVIATMLSQMGLYHTRTAQLILSSALVHDAVGYILLGFVACHRGSGGSDTVQWLPAAGTVGFLLLMYVMRKPIFAGFRRVGYRSQTQYALLTMAATLALFASAVTQFIGIHVVLGAFVTGLVIGQLPIIEKSVRQPFRAFTDSVLAPIFFATAGLNCDFSKVFSIRGLAAVAIVLALAGISKIGGCILGGTLCRFQMSESMCIGIGANTFGAVGLIVGLVCYSLNLITREFYTIIVLVSLLSTAIAPSALSWAFSRVSKKEISDNEFIGRLSKKFLPEQDVRILVGNSDRHELSACRIILSGLGHFVHGELTVLEIKPGNPGNNRGGPGLPQDFAQCMGGLVVISRTVEDKSYSIGLMQEAKRGYDLVVLPITGADDLSVLGHDIICPSIADGMSAFIFLKTQESDASESTSESKSVAVIIDGTPASLTVGKLAAMICSKHALTLMAILGEDAGAAECILRGIATKYDVDLTVSVVPSLEAMQIKQIVETYRPALIIASSALRYETPDIAIPVARDLLLMSRPVALFVST